MKALPATILLVDDADQGRRFAGAILEKHGYWIATADSGERGLELFLERPAKIDLVVTDVIMPGMTGPEMVERMLAVRPRLPIVFVTAYPPDTVVSAHLRSRFPVLHKPIRAHALLEAVRAGLGGATMTA